MKSEIIALMLVFLFAFGNLTYSEDAPRKMTVAAWTSQMDSFLPVVVDSERGPLALGSDAFELKISNKNVPIRAVFSDGVPVYVAILIDVSPSMQEGWHDLRAGLVEWLQDVGGQMKENNTPFSYSVTIFNGEMKSVVPRTDSMPEEVAGLLEKEEVSKKGLTHLFDSIVPILDTFQNFSAVEPIGKKVLVLITDGEDNASMARNYHQAWKQISQGHVQTCVLATSNHSRLISASQHPYINRWIGSFNATSRDKAGLLHSALEDIDRVADEISQFSTHVGESIRGGGLSGPVYCNHVCESQRKELPFYGARDLMRLAEATGGLGIGLLDYKKGVKVGMETMLRRVLHDTYILGYRTQDVSPTDHKKKVKVFLSDTIKTHLRQANIKADEITLAFPKRIDQAGNFLGSKP